MHRPQVHSETHNQQCSYVDPLGGSETSAIAGLQKVCKIV